MENSNHRDWVIFFYLNGNNELAPEMLHAKLNVEAEGSDENVDVLVQHDSIERQVVEIIRPGYHFQDYSLEPAGVSRYHISYDYSATFENLGNVNMADPKSLYDFIQWGMENYPARHYMLVLGGHVFQYVGLMPDYSQDKPYLMGYPEMVNALELIYKNLGKKIDLMVLDTCYFNRIEMLYELGKSEDPPVSQVLTHISGGPLSGLPYHTLINTLKGYHHIPADKVIHKIISNLNYDLIAYEISHQKLEEIKKLYNDLALCCLNSSTFEATTPSELLTNFDKKLPWHLILRDLAAKMPSLTIDYKNLSNSPFGHFYVSAQKLCDPYKVSLYSKLAFSRNNNWFRLLCQVNSSLSFCEDNCMHLKPFVISPNELYALISVMNPTLSFEQHQQIVRDLIVFKGWKW